jgi:hypothetical protein
LSRHAQAIPKEHDGFLDWWAQHHSEFGGLAESQARSIYDAGQPTMLDALREVRQYLENSGKKNSDRIERDFKKVADRSSRQPEIPLHR